MTIRKKKHHSQSRQRLHAFQRRPSTALKNLQKARNAIPIASKNIDAFIFIAVIIITSPSPPCTLSHTHVMNIKVYFAAGKFHVTGKIKIRNILIKGLIHEENQNALLTSYDQ